MFRELRFILIFLRDFIKENHLLDLYQQLISFYQQVQSSSTEELEKSIEDTRAQIITTHSLVNYSSWSATKISILKRIGGYKVIGQEAMDEINQIFEKKVGNTSAIVQHLTEFKALTNEVLTKSEQLIKEMNLEEPLEELEKGMQIIEISFEGNATLENFWQIKDRACDLDFIVRAFTRLVGENFEKASIVSINSASHPVVVYLKVCMKTALALIEAAKAAVDLKKIKDEFFKNKKTVQGLPISGSTIEIAIKDLEVSNEEGYKKKIGELSFRITQPYKGNRKGTGEANELENMIGIALGKMANLIGDGVRVLNPQEIRPMEKLEESSLGVAYAELAKLDSEAKPLLEVETQKRLGDRRLKMLNEFKELRKLDKTLGEKKDNGAGKNNPIIGVLKKRKSDKPPKKQKPVIPEKSTES